MGKYIFLIIFLIALSACSNFDVYNEGEKCEHLAGNYICKEAKSYLDTFWYEGDKSRPSYYPSSPSVIANYGCVSKGARKGSGPKLGFCVHEDADANKCPGEEVCTELDKVSIVQDLDVCEFVFPGEIGICSDESYWDIELFERPWWVHPSDLTYQLAGSTKDCTKVGPSSDTGHQLECFRHDPKKILQGYSISIPGDFEKVFEKNYYNLEDIDYAVSIEAFNYQYCMAKTKSGAVAYTFVNCFTDDGQEGVCGACGNEITLDDIECPPESVCVPDYVSDGEFWCTQGQKFIKLENVQGTGTECTFDPSGVKGFCGRCVPEEYIAEPPTFPEDKDKYKGFESAYCDMGALCHRDDIEELDVLCPEWSTEFTFDDPTTEEFFEYWPHYSDRNDQNMIGNVGCNRGTSIHNEGFCGRCTWDFDDLRYARYSGVSDEDEDSLVCPSNAKQIFKSKQYRSLVEYIVKIPYRLDTEEKRIKAEVDFDMWCRKKSHLSGQKLIPTVDNRLYWEYEDYYFCGSCAMENYCDEGFDCWSEEDPCPEEYDPIYQKVISKSGEENVQCILKDGTKRTGYCRKCLQKIQQCDQKAGVDFNCYKEPPTCAPNEELLLQLEQYGDVKDKLKECEYRVGQETILGNCYWCYNPSNEIIRYTSESSLDGVPYILEEHNNLLDPDEITYLRYGQGYGCNFLTETKHKCLQESNMLRNFDNFFGVYWLNTHTEGKIKQLPEEIWRPFAYYCRNEIYNRFTVPQVKVYSEPKGVRFYGRDTYGDFELNRVRFGDRWGIIAYCDLDYVSKTQAHVEQKFN